MGRGIDTIQGQGKRWVSIFAQRLMALIEVGVRGIDTRGRGIDIRAREMFRWVYELLYCNDGEISACKRTK